MEPETLSSDLPDERQQIAELLGEPVAAVDLLSGGKNSRVLRAKADSGRIVAAKFYFSDPGDHRDRFASELQALQFMQQAGISCVPKIAAVNTGRRCLVLEFISGERGASALAPKDMHRLSQFVSVLREAAELPEAGSLPKASEAVFSLAALSENLEHRFSALTSRPAETSVSHQRCSDFLRSILAPRLRVFEHAARDLYASLGIQFEDELPKQRWTLSPSDLGFHNGIRREDGSWIFQDFEHFGWDDPAKLIIDLLLHPAMNLSPDLANIFLRETIPMFERKDDGLRSRVRALYPLFGVKWCLILLNEFLPAAAARRRFADAANSSNEGSVLDVQLSKSIKMLETVNSRWEHLNGCYEI